MELHPLVKVVIGVVGVGLVSVAIWFGRTSVDLSEDTANGGTPNGKPPEIDGDLTPLPISPTGPYPKVVIAETTHKFSVMTVGSEGKHLFIIQNKGKSPLLLKKGETTCKCTISKVGDGEIPPGGEAHVELIWKAVAVNAEFRQTATITTNDPKLRSLELVIVGSIDAPFEIRPRGGWTLDKLVVDEPTKLFGQVISTVHESFEIESPLKSSSKLLTSVITPLTPEECQKMSVKCGYVIEATLKPEMPIGPFREYLTIQTNLPNSSPVNMFVNGTRTGPITILPTGNTRWNHKAMVVNLGEFDATQGAKASLLLFIAGLDETKFQFLSVEKNLETLGVTLKPDPNFQSESRQKFRLTFEVPPGSPTEIRTIDRPVRVIIKTNHPEAEELKFRIKFISR